MFKIGWFMVSSWSRWQLNYLRVRVVCGSNWKFLWNFDCIVFAQVFIYLYMFVEYVWIFAACVTHDIKFMNLRRLLTNCLCNRFLHYCKLRRRRDYRGGRATTTDNCQLSYVDSIKTTKIHSKGDWRLETHILQILV